MAFDSDLPHRAACRSTAAMDPARERILIVVGNPGTASLDLSLAEAYGEGARESGAEVRELRLSALHFDPILHEGHHGVQELEPDLRAAQESILWANHLVIVYPIWWGSVPALLKGFIDRTLNSGFAYRYHDDGPLWDKLLRGRSARLITTSDAPGWWIRFAYRNSDVAMMKHAVLEFCGVTPVRVTRFTRTRHRSDSERGEWIARARALGERCA